jgi:hypothetical protein
MLVMQIVNIHGCNYLLYKHDEITRKANNYYKRSLESRADSLTDLNYLQLLELKHVGCITEVPANLNSSKKKIHC